MKLLDKLWGVLAVLFIVFVFGLGANLCVETVQECQENDCLSRPWPISNDGPRPGYPNPDNLDP